jgi:hypothetical protein
MINLYKYGVLVLLALMLSACGTFIYSPDEYVITPERISPLGKVKPVSLINVQQAQKFIAFDGPSKFEADYKDVTQAFVNQLAKEIINRGGKVTSDAKKTIKIAVTDLHAESLFMRFKGHITYRLELGNGKTLNLREENTSPGNIYRTLNGTIARAVIQALSNSELRDYLAN